MDEMRTILFLVFSCSKIKIVNSQSDLSNDSNSFSSNQSPTLLTTFSQTPPNPLQTPSLRNYSDSFITSLLNKPVESSKIFTNSRQNQVQPQTMTTHPIDHQSQASKPTLISHPNDPADIEDSQDYGRNSDQIQRIDEEDFRPENEEKMGMNEEEKGDGERRAEQKVTPQNRAHNYRYLYREMQTPEETHKKTTEFYAWIFGASILTLAFLITLGSCLAFTVCGSKWRLALRKPHRRHRPAIGGEPDYERVDSVSSIVDHAATSSQCGSRVPDDVSRTCSNVCYGDDVISVGYQRSALESENPSDYFGSVLDGASSHRSVSLFEDADCASRSAYNDDVSHGSLSYDIPHSCQCQYAYDDDRTSYRRTCGNFNGDLTTSVTAF